MKKDKQEFMYLIFGLFLGLIIGFLFMITLTKTISQVNERYLVIGLNLCQMTNKYHDLVILIKPNLSLEIPEKFDCNKLFAIEMAD